MGLPADKVDICNLALSLLKSDIVVTNIEEPENEEEEVCSKWYDITRQAVLRAFSWNFAKKRASISRSGTPEEYADEYQLPDDYVNLVFIGEDIDEDYETDYSIEGDKILINNGAASTLNIKYIWNIENVQKFDPLFTMLLVHELAIVLANQISGLNKSTKKIDKDRDRWEVKARSKNGQENHPRQRYVSPLASAKRRGRSSSLSDGVHLF